MTRKISEIAREIRNDWVRPHYAAKPYLEAMRELDSIDQMHINDTARSVVGYFLANAHSWKGETARRVKAELRAMVKGK